MHLTRLSDPIIFAGTVCSPGEAGVPGPGHKPTTTAVSWAFYELDRCLLGEIAS